MSVHPTFDAARDCVTDLGVVGPFSLRSVAKRAVRAMRGYKRYGIVGANCQHFASDLLQELNVEAALQTDDQLAVQRVAQGVAVVGVAGSSALGACTSITGAAACAGAVGVAGAAAILGL